MDKGLFITLEGVEGVGKTTQIEPIAEWFRQHGREVVVTREPGGTPAGEAVRELLLKHSAMRIDGDTELLLIFAARAQHLAEIVRPALALGQVVVCDRFTDASFAYQGGGRGIEATRIAQLEAWVQQGLKPELTLLLDAPAGIGMERAGQRNSTADRFEAEPERFFSAVRETYLEIARAEPARVYVIDAARSASEVTDEIRTQLAQRFL